MNGRRTHAFAEDAGTLTVPGEKIINTNCTRASRRITRYATYPCNTSTLGAVEPGSDIVLESEDSRCSCCNMQGSVCPRECGPRHLHVIHCFAHCLRGANDTGYKYPSFVPSRVHRTFILRPPCLPTTTGSLTKSRPVVRIARYLSRHPRYTGL